MTVYDEEEPKDREQFWLNLWAGVILVFLVGFAFIGVASVVLWAV